MNGWERLATVIAMPMCAIGFFMGHADKSIYETQDLTADLAQIAQAEETQDQFWTAYWNRSGWRSVGKIGECIESTISADYHPADTYSHAKVSITCERQSNLRIWAGIKYAAYPAIAMFVFCMLISWIAEGFRRPKK